MDTNISKLLTLCKFAKKAKRRRYMEEDELDSPNASNIEYRMANRSLPNIIDVSGPYQNAKILGRETSHSVHKDFNSKIDKNLGAKLKGKISLSALPKTISQTTHDYYPINASQGSGAV